MFYTISTDTNSGMTHAASKSHLSPINSSAKDERAEMITENFFS